MRSPRWWEKVAVLRTGLGSSAGTALVDKSSRPRKEDLKKRMKMDEISRQC